ncbi:MAG: hypothetical protein Q6A81_05110 [Enterococcus casseliflavus]|nr:hypothetical protein [Enterococcus casseliflavus]
MAYSFEQELLIQALTKDKIRELHNLLNDRKQILSEWQVETARRDLKQYQELQYQNRLNRQINI